MGGHSRWKSNSHRDTVLDTCDLPLSSPLLAVHGSAHRRHIVTRSCETDSDLCLHRTNIATNIRLKRGLVFSNCLAPNIGTHSASRNPCNAHFIAASSCSVTSEIPTSCQTYPYCLPSCFIINPELMYRFSGSAGRKERSWITGSNKFNSW